jgi:anthranilate synthase component 1
MLLDLGRNDVGKVSKVNTVKVTEKFKVEKIFSCNAHRL